MAVYLYEDLSGCLYLHKHGEEEVYCHIELVVPAGARFMRDAEEIEDGIKADRGTEVIPFSELEDQLATEGIRRVAVYENGKISPLSHMGGDARTYIGIGDHVAN